MRKHFSTWPDLPFRNRLRASFCLFLSLLHGYSLPRHNWLSCYWFIWTLLGLVIEYILQFTGCIDSLSSSNQRPPVSSRGLEVTPCHWALKADIMSTAWRRREPDCPSSQLHSCHQVISFVFVQPGNTVNRWSGRKRLQCYLLSLQVAELKTTLNAASYLWGESEGDYFFVIMNSLEMTHSCRLWATAFFKSDIDFLISSFLKL